MAIQDFASTMLKRLEEGTAQIYSRYEKLLTASKKKYDDQAKEIQREYESAANEASARSKIDYKNVREQMADSGYIRSGETVHATLSANANRASALSNLAAQKARDLSSLAEQQASQEVQIGMEAEKEADALRQDIEEKILEQEKADREYEAQKAQQEFENNLALEKLRWEKEKYAWEKADAEKEKSEKENSSSELSDDGLQPKRSAYLYLEDIVKKYTKNVKGKNYAVVDRQKIRNTIAQIVRDTSISRQYRYELFFYAKTLGYTEV